MRGDTSCSHDRSEGQSAPWGRGHDTAAEQGHAEHEMTVGDPESHAETHSGQVPSPGTTTFLHEAHRKLGPPPMQVCCLPRSALGHRGQPGLCALGLYPDQSHPWALRSQAGGRLTRQPPSLNCGPGVGTMSAKLQWKERHAGCRAQGPSSWGRGGVEPGPRTGTRRAHSRFLTLGPRRPRSPLPAVGDSTRAQPQPLAQRAESLEPSDPAAHGPACHRPESITSVHGRPGRPAPQSRATDPQPRQQRAHSGPRTQKPKGLRPRC